MPIRAIRQSPNFAFQPLPNGALLTDTSWQAFQNAQSQLSTRGRTESHSGQWHNGTFRPLVGVHARVPSSNNAGGFFLGVSQCQIDLTLPPGYNRLWIAYQTRLQTFQAHQNTLLGSRIDIDLMQMGAGLRLTSTGWQDNQALPLHVREVVQVFELGSIFRLSAQTETRLALRVTYDTCEGVRDYDGLQAVGQLTNPAWWDGLGWLTYGVYRG